MSRAQSEAATQFNGPSWRDILIHWYDLNREIGVVVRMELGITRSVKGELGLYITPRLVDTPLPGLGCGYGPAYPNGAKTLPAALERFLWEIHDKVLEERARLAMAAEGQLDWTKDL